MKSLWQERTRTEVLSRIDGVSESSHRRWGTMSAARMLRHLVRAMSMAVEELPTTPKKMPFRYFPLKQLVIYVLPIPNDVPTVPELLVKEDVIPIDESRRELKRLLGKFADRGGMANWPEHPAFGPLSKLGWGVLTYRHIDHHLRQFSSDR
jgi:hypothetical protein